jgi:glutamine synthetase
MESATLLELTDTDVLPAVESEIDRLASMMSHIKEAGKAISIDRLEDMKAIYENILKAHAALEVEVERLHSVHDESSKASALSTQVMPAMLKLREFADDAEGRVADHLWTLPKYREMLFLK